MDLNWCPVCEQHIPLAWESSLYCSDKCKKADALASHPGLGYSYPADLQSFPRSQKNSSATASPLSSPTLSSINPTSSAYPSPPTSPMTNYIYTKTASSGRISPPAFSLGHPAATAAPTSSHDYLEMRRKSSAGPQYLNAMNTNTTTTTSNNAKKGFFW